MNKNLLLFFACFGAIFVPKACAQSWQWARGSTCSAPHGGSEGWLVKGDHAGNVFLSGFYYGDSICVGSNTFHNPVNPANNVQTLIVKYDSAGTLLWARAGSNGQSRPIAMVTDSANDLYIFGYFTKDSIRFGTEKLVNAGFDTLNPDFNYCYYLLKYDASGALLWARSGTGNFHPDGDYLHPGGIAIDVAGNIYVTATFNKRTIAFGADTLYNVDPANGTNDIFVAKYSAAGDLYWYRSFGGTKDDYVLDMAAGNDNRLYITGYFRSGFIQFGSTKLFTNNKKGYLACLDTAGNALWAVNAGDKATARSLATDEAGSVYNAGGFIDTVVFSNNYTYHNANGGFFLVKYDNKGNVLAVHVFYPTQSLISCCNVYSMATDHCNNVWLSINLEPGRGVRIDSANTVYPPTNSVDPTFFAGFSQGGDLVEYAALPSGSGNNTGLANTGLAIDNTGNVLFAADYRAIDPFVIGPDSLHLYNGEQTNIFVAKYKPGTNCDTVAPPVYPAVPIITIYPNPASGIGVLDYYGNFGNGAQAALRDITGRLITIFPVTAQLTPFSTELLPDGVYICTVKVQGRALYAIRFVVLH